MKMLVEKLLTSASDFFDTLASKQRIQNEQLIEQRRQELLKQQYYEQYYAIANGLVHILNAIQAKKPCLLYYDVDVVCQAVKYCTRNTMPFYIPYAYNLKAEQKEAVMRKILEGMQCVLGQVYPQFRACNVFDDIFKLKITSYGFDLVSLKAPFY